MISDWRRRQVVGGLLLTLVTLVGAWLRFQTLDEPLWLDELHTGWVVTHGLSKIPERAAAGNQAATYFYLEWLSTQGWGATGWGLRFPSIVASIATMALSGVFVGRWSGSTIAGLLTALLVAGDVDFVFYGGEARVYALLQAFGLIHLAALQRLDRHSSRGWRMAWIASGVWLVYLHYTTLLVVGTGCLVRWWQAPERRRATLIDAVAMLVGMLPTVASLAQVAARRRSWGETLAPDSLLALFPWGAELVAPLLGVVLVVAIEWLRGQKASRVWRRPHRVRVLTTLAVLVAIPVLVAALATAAQQAQLLRYRYLILPATFLPLATGLLVGMAPSRWGRGLVALLVLAVAAPSSVWWVRLSAERASLVARRENWPAAMDSIRRELAAHPGPVLLCAGLVEDRDLIDETPPPGWQSHEALVEFCRFPLRSLDALECPDEDLIPLPTRRPPRTTAAVRGRLAQSEYAWLVVRGTRAAAQVISEGLHDELANEGEQLEIDEVREFGGVTVVRLKRRTAREGTT